jgi:hypothetical protein
MAGKRKLHYIKNDHYENNQLYNLLIVKKILSYTVLFVLFI